MAGFSFILSKNLQSRVNLQKVLPKTWSKNSRSFESFDFGMTLVLQLARPVEEKVKLSFGESKENDYNSSLLSTYPLQSVKRRRCWVCLSFIAGRGFKRKRDCLAKILSQCQRCGKCVCQKHFFRFCKNCLQWRYFLPLFGMAYSHCFHGYMRQVRNTFFMWKRSLKHAFPTFWSTVKILTLMSVNLGSTVKCITLFLFVCSVEHHSYTI